MAIYSLNVSNVSRAKGSSSLATLSYITATKTRDDRLQRTFNFRARSERVICSKTLLPQSAPAEWSDPGALYNAAEAADARIDARTAKKVMIALPREFDRDLQERVIEDFVRTNLTEHGYAATYAIHTDAANNNPHAHILVVNRPITQSGKWGAKHKTVNKLDADGNRIPVIDPSTGKQKLGARNRKQWQRTTVNHLLDQRQWVEDARASWAEICNQYLAPEEQIDHRSYADRGIDRKPTIHEGYAAQGIERDGGRSDRAEQNRSVRQVNALTEEIAVARQELNNLSWDYAAERADITREANAETKSVEAQSAAEIDKIEAEYAAEVKELKDEREYIIGAIQRNNERQGFLAQGSRALAGSLYGYQWQVERIERKVEGLGRQVANVDAAAGRRADAKDNSGKRTGRAAGETERLRKLGIRIRALEENLGIRIRALEEDLGGGLAERIRKAVVAAVKRLFGEYDERLIGWLEQRTKSTTANQGAMRSTQEQEQELVEDGIVMPKAEQSTDQQGYDDQSDDYSAPGAQAPAPAPEPVQASRGGQEHVYQSHHDYELDYQPPKPKPVTPVKKRKKRSGR